MNTVFMMYLFKFLIIQCLERVKLWLRIMGVFIAL